MHTINMSKSLFMFGASFKYKPKNKHLPLT
jgi:hypothetical protein